MKKGAKLLQGTHDYSTFRASTCYAKSPETLHQIKVNKSNDIIKVTFSSKSFLHNQVRSMIGFKYLSTVNGI